MHHQASYVKYFHFLRVNAKHEYMHGVHTWNRTGKNRQTGRSGPVELFKPVFTGLFTHF